MSMTRMWRRLSSASSPEIPLAMASSAQLGSLGLPSVCAMWITSELAISKSIWHLSVRFFTFLFLLFLSLFCLQPSVCLLFLPVERVFFSLCFLISIPIMPVCSVAYILGACNVCCCSNWMSSKLKEPICKFFLSSKRQLVDRCDMHGHSIILCRMWEVGIS